MAKDRTWQNFKACTRDALAGYGRRKTGGLGIVGAAIGRPRAADRRTYGKVTIPGVLQSAANLLIKCLPGASIPQLCDGQ